MKISEQILHPVHTPRVTTLLLDQWNVAELLEGCVSSLGRRQSGSKVKFNLSLEMVAQLLVQVLLDTMAAEQRPQPKPDSPERAHSSSTSLTRGARFR